MPDEVFAGRVGLLSTRSTNQQRTVVRMSGEGPQFVEEVSGRFASRNYAGKVFTFSVAAVTVPVNANNLVSVCGIYNPPGSNTLVEIIDTDVTNVLATTVVQAFQWVSSTAALSAAATFTTLATPRSGRAQDGASNVARVYSAVTHSGTPTLEKLVGGHGATTNVGYTISKVFNGTLLIPPGILMSLCTTTAASTSSGITMGFSWAEMPY